MDVVTAGVHHTFDLRVNGACLVLLHRQAVDVASQDHAATRSASFEGEDAAGFGGPQRLGDSQCCHVVADHRSRFVFRERQLGEAVEGSPLVDHVVEDRVGGDRPEEVVLAHRRPTRRHRLRRSRAMWVTWISSVPA